MPRHSLIHGISPAKCNLAWDEMEGTDTVRTCPICEAKVYRIDGEDEEQIRELVTITEPGRDLTRLKLYRRSDGTVMTARGNCRDLAHARVLMTLAIHGMFYGFAIFSPRPQTAFTTPLVFVTMGIFGELLWRLIANKANKLGLVVYWVSWALSMGVLVWILHSAGWGIDFQLGKLLIPMLVPLHIWLVARSEQGKVRVMHGLRSIAKLGD